MFEVGSFIFPVSLLPPKNAFFVFQMKARSFILPIE